MREIDFCFFTLAIREENADSQMDEHELELLIRSRCFEEETVKTNRLSKVPESDRLNLCFAARVCIQEFSPRQSFSLLWQNNRVEAPQEFEIDADTKIVALACPTRPPVYVHVIDSRDCVEVFLIVED